MRLPQLLLQRKPGAHKNDFGHILILAGSSGMLGAAALSALSAMRSGAGLVTVGIPRTLNLALQKKLSPVIMTLPLPETKGRTLSLDAFPEIKKRAASIDIIALGPGLTQNPNTAKLILKIIGSVKKPLVLDADALNALKGKIHVLRENLVLKILTPHPGEMSRLTGLSRKFIENNREKISRQFAKAHHCIVLLKGHRTVVASPGGKFYTNTTGNPGMASAGSGDVLTGIIAAFLAQGLPGFDAAKYAAYIHGKAGDSAAKEKGTTSLIAIDIIEKIPEALRSSI